MAGLNERAPKGGPVTLALTGHPPAASRHTTKEDTPAFARCQATAAASDPILPFSARELRPGTRCAAGGEGVEIPPPVVASAAVAVYTAAAPALPAPTEVSPARARRGPWELHNDVVDALDVLPDVFDRNDVCRVIGYEPDRGSLYRTFLDLKQEGALVVQKRGSGRSPTLYRKTIASDATAAE